MNCNPGRIVVNYCKKIPSANKGAISGCRALSAGEHVGGYDVQPIRVGILGPGNIVRRVMTDFHRAERVVLSAVASRDAEKAQKAARAYGAPLAFESGLRFNCPAEITLEMSRTAMEGIYDHYQ